MELNGFCCYGNGLPGVCPLQPSLQQSVDPQELTFIEEERCYIIPDGVRPVLKTFRIEVSHRLLALHTPVTQLLGSTPVCVCVCARI